MANKEKRIIVVQSLDFNTSELSGIARYTNLGMLGTIWTSMVTEPEAFSIDQNMLCGLPVLTALRISLLAVLIALMFDFAQYFAGYIRDLKALNRLESSTEEASHAYSKSCNWRRAARTFFLSKLVLTAINLLWMVLTMAAIIPA